MRVGARHLDQRRLLTPRDYFVDPSTFGLVPGAPTHIPPGGDQVSLRIARLQHGLVCQWALAGRTPTVAALCRRFEMSKQTLSLVTLGKRWAGETVLAALVHAASESARNTRSR